MNLGDTPRYAAEIWRHLLVRTNYLLGNYKKKVWLVGDGRSGTTWLSEVLNWDGTLRDMFEPFHPFWVRGMTHLPPYPSMMPGTTDTAFQRLAGSVFSGKFSNGRTDAANRRLRYNGLMIKDVQANLFLAWAMETFPHLISIFLMRHPFAVAVSKCNVSGGVWLEDPRIFLDRKDLNPFLKPFITLIENVGEDPIERHIMIWAIVNFIPRQQLRNDQVIPVFYEHLLSKPQQYLPPLLQRIHGPLPAATVQSILMRITKPSKTAFAGSHVGHKNPLTAWCDQLTEEQIQRGLHILDAFGLTRLYTEEPMPHIAHPLG